MRRQTVFAASSVSAGVVLAVALTGMVNWIGYRHYARADWTSSKVFSLGLVENLATGAAVKGALGYMNLWNHMDDFAKGIVDTRHVVYNLSLTGLFLFLATKALEASKGR